jgi:hypothetical protein
MSEGAPAPTTWAPRHFWASQRAPEPRRFPESSRSSVAASCDGLLRSFDTFVATYAHLSPNWRHSFVRVLHLRRRTREIATANFGE